MLILGLKALLLEIRYLKIASSVNKNIELEFIGAFLKKKTKNKT